MKKTTKTITLSGILLCLPAANAADLNLSKDWQPLFNGKNLDGWRSYFIKYAEGQTQPASNFFKVKNGVIHVYPNAEHKSAQPYAAIETEQSFSHYRFSLEYKWGHGKYQPRVNLLKDAGLLYHAHGFGKPAWPLSVESQIQQGDSGDTYTIGTQVSTFVDPTSYLHNPKGSVSSWDYQPEWLGGVWKTHGTANKIKRIKHDRVAEHPGWNRMDIIVRGDKAIHMVNGQINMRIQDFKYWQAEQNQWLPLTQGKIVLQAEGAEVFYRNIKIRKIIDSDPF
ncbi:hypothetical protein C2869_07565 [Saccharobesus litoralis]|uniref:3-keto-alpha-glucoside-1,2-lyase/3-keto-2-hydroxy-glucal hydratase domain-containing protein n=1 Tax=Saccharobesus litoralis TaxID=2172099 RepID=A0A2S0VQ04_9ALTE|nr:DUF1080 domain-containing protein [Saccharobesus litoralis]AWB66298.1 hypothetical protein C2869_07565 [Saccharobesus litoralis]